jgi:hypothetical protein
MVFAELPKFAPVDPKEIIQNTYLLKLFNG